MIGWLFRRKKARMKMPDPMGRPPTFKFVMTILVVIFAGYIFYQLNHMSSSSRMNTLPLHLGKQVMIGYQIEDVAGDILMQSEFLVHKDMSLRTTLPSGEKLTIKILGVDEEVEDKSGLNSP